MASISVQTQIIDRDELAKLVPLKNFRLIKFFENLAKDVSKTIPDAIETSVQGPSGGSVDDNVVVFDGSTGFKVKDSGVSIDDLAPLESPAFTGIPTAPTATPGTSTEQLATTAFVDAATGNAVNGPAGATDNAIALFDGTTGKLIQDSAVLLSSLATLASPTFTGTPAAPTAALGTDTTQLANTAFVQDAIDNLAANASSFSVHNNGAGQSIPDNTFTKLTFSTEVFDTGGHFASSTWTPPAGKPVMLVGAVALVTAVNTLTTIAVYKNGAEFKRGAMVAAPNTTTHVVQVTCIDIPNGTDYYELFAYQNTGVAQNTNGVSNLTYFQGTTLQA